MPHRTLLAVLCGALLLAGCDKVPQDEPSSSPSVVQASSQPGFVLQPDEGETLFGGPRGGKVTIKVDSQQTATRQLAKGVQHYPPGSGVPVHKHEHGEEALFVHKGGGVGILGDERVPLQSGTTVYIPPGTWHGIESVENEGTTEIMWIVTPGTGESTQLADFFRATRVPEGQPLRSFTPEEFREILLKHDQIPKEP